MTLDEAIKHCEEKAKEQKEKATAIARAKEPFYKYAECYECSKEHEQLASWLKELKAYKERPQGDLISRQDAIDVLEEQLDYLRTLNKNENPTVEGKWYGVNWARNTIADLPSVEERPQCDIRWTDKLSVKSNGDIIDFEGRVIGHIDSEDKKGGAE